MRMEVAQEMSFSRQLGKVRDIHPSQDVGRNFGVVVGVVPVAVARKGTFYRIGHDFQPLIFVIYLLGSGRK